MRQGGDKKIPAQDKFLNEFSLIRRMIDEDVREHRDSGKGLGHFLWIVRREVKELSLVADQLEAQRRKVIRVIREVCAQGGERRFIVDK